MKKTTTTIISWNVNGIRAVARKGALDCLLEESPDIVCLQETKAQPEQAAPVMKHWPKYRAYFRSAQRMGYSGVAVLSKTEPIKVQEGMGHSTFDTEGRFLLLEYPQFTLINIYFPNGKKDQERLNFKMAYYDKVLRLATNLDRKGKSLIICGDVNTAHKEIDLSQPKENENTSGFLPMERAWIDSFLSKGFVDTFRHFEKGPNNYTWWDFKTKARERNIGWRIDYFFVNKRLLPKVAKTYIRPDIMGSDHCPIGIEIRVNSS